MGAGALSNVKILAHLRLSAGFSTWRPYRDRLLWFRRALSLHHSW